MTHHYIIPPTFTQYEIDIIHPEHKAKKRYRIKSPIYIDRKVFREHQLIWLGAKVAAGLIDSLEEIDQ